ncbi:GntR family transcriptional regulator [Actinocatenispora comari]|jgi:GntR family transcriptional regulator|uniref:HTH gntR-type domain-containing protein n=1 Tax=Actinocatenispora comari TaxID=2807577 RepID=A0A8J4AIU6_9ACTN|nr:GntR family transcriptional regulator [Actinocatenispora comari]GIL31549.1 hypothetical protein NUM_68030 [Actinocatenispora comari]
MVDWTKVKPGAYTPVYVQIAQLVRDAISAGEFGPGDRLPSETVIQQETGISRLTTRKSYRMLQDEGLIVTVQGRGSFVLPVDET